MKCWYHGSLHVYGLPPYGEPRCRFCGHRLPVDGVDPTQSRELPFWTWPLEILGRLMAKWW